MGVCTTISSVPHLIPNHNNNHHPLYFKTLLSKPLNRTRPSFKRTYPGWHYLINSSLKSTTSEEASSGATQYVKDETNDVVMIGDVQRGEQNESYGAVDVQTVEKNESDGAQVPSEQSFKDEQFQPFDLLDKLNLELDLDSPYPLLIYGGGSLITLWLASAVVGSIDSIPVFPKLMEVVGLGYSLWFATRYLLFKKNREELTAKIEEIKQEVLGSRDD